MSDRLRLWLGVALMALAAAVCAFGFTSSNIRQPDAYPAKALPPLGVKAVPVVHGQVRVNTDDADSLTVLPGVGPALAEAVVKERNAHGDFYYPEDLISAKGIGKKKLAAFRDMLELGTGGD